MRFENLQAGIYAQNDATTAQLADKIREQAAQHGTSPLQEVSAYLKTLKHDTSHKDQLFRKRCASEIVESGFQTGCTDRSVVFLALAAECGVPAVYVETLRKATLGTPEAGEEGHVFTKVYDAKRQKWDIYDPINGYKQKYELGGDAYLPVALGRDHSATYRVNARGEFATEPEAIGSEDALRALAASLEYAPSGARICTQTLGEREGRVR